VEELAARGITVEALLEFYEGLGKRYMKGYRPEAHTTNDVVRLAIIPESQSCQTDLAFVLMKGKRVWPMRMVTHSWGNLFYHLVAAILADALQDHSYSMIAELLSRNGGVGVLRRILMRSGRLLDTYWVCAFAVNQHASICHDPHGAVDSVTKVALPSCPCGLTKFKNETPPLTLDGRSCPCEMNKFEDMMEFCAEHVRDFSQVIAVDAAFGLFSRAWCVAELATAHRLGLRQQLKLRSHNDLKQKEKDLRELRIENMQASRKEDIEEILKNIPDCQAFNKSVQNLIFDERSGLLAAWHSLDTRRQLREAGRLLRWHAVDDGTGIVWECWSKAAGDSMSTISF